MKSKSETDDARNNSNYLNRFREIVSNLPIEYFYHDPNLNNLISKIAANNKQTIDLRFIRTWMYMYGSITPKTPQEKNISDNWSTILKDALNMTKLHPAKLIVLNPLITSIHEYLVPIQDSYDNIQSNYSKRKSMSSSKNVLERALLNVPPNFPFLFSRNDTLLLVNCHKSYYGDPLFGELLGRFKLVKREDGVDKNKLVARADNGNYERVNISNREFNVDLKDDMDMMEQFKSDPCWFRDITIENYSSKINVWNDIDKQLPIACLMLKNAIDEKKNAKTTSTGKIWVDILPHFRARISIRKLESYDNSVSELWIAVKSRINPRKQSTPHDVYSVFPGMRTNWYRNPLSSVKPAITGFYNTVVGEGIVYKKSSSDWTNMSISGLYIKTFEHGIEIDFFSVARRPWE